MHSGTGMVRFSAILAQKSPNLVKKIPIPAQDSPLLPEFWLFPIVFPDLPDPVSNYFDLIT
jgi:hypothetical protein